MLNLVALGLCGLLQAQADPARQAQELIESLRSDKVDERDAAAKKLKDLGKAALPELEKAALSADRELSTRARFLLKVIPIRLRLTPNLIACVPGVDDRLAFGDDHTWTTVLLEVADQVTVEVAPPDKGGAGLNRRVPKMWKDSPDSGKVLPLKGPDARALVLPAIRGAKDSEEREAVFDVLVQRNLHSSIPELLSLIKDDDPAIRSRGIKVLSDLRAAEAVAEFRHALKDSVASVRASATHALAIVGTQEVITDLVGMLKDVSGDVRLSAVVSLNLRDAKEGIPGIIAVLADPDARVRAFAANALGSLGSRESIPGLLKLLQDEDVQARIFAVDALGKLKASEAAPQVARLLEDRVASVRLSSVRALSALEGKAAVPYLEKALEVQDPEVQRTAIDELWTRRAREAIPSICRLLESGNPDLRLFAAVRLCQFGSREGVPAVLEAARHLWALNRIRRPELCERLHEQTYDEAKEGPRKQLVERIAQERGLTVTWANEPGGTEAPWMSEHCSAGPTGVSSLGALVNAVNDPDYDMVLEPGQVRILRHEEALAFWKKWWADQGEKK